MRKQWPEEKNGMKGRGKDGEQAKIKNPYVRQLRKAATGRPQEGLGTLQPANDYDDASDPKRQKEATSNPANSHVPHGLAIQKGHV